MIVISRALARQVRAVARTCVPARTRSPAPAVVVRVAGGTRTVWVRAEGVSVVHTAPSDDPDETLVVPMRVLEAVEGPTPAPVEFVVGPRLKGTARWTDDGSTRTEAFDALLPGKQHNPPPAPAGMARAPAELLTALHECGRTAARDAGRLALSHVQLRGRAGEVVGTDGHRALVWGGFKLRFRDDALAPAVPVFGCRELAAEADVRLGVTPTEVVVAAGPWRVHLPRHTGKFPDVAAVIPPAGAGGEAALDPQDVAGLAAALPTLPGAGEENRPVTLVLSRDGVAVRGRDEGTGAVKEVRLIRSTASGPPRAVAVDRTALARGLALGCHAVRVDPAGKVVALAGPNRTFVFAALDPSLVVSPTAVVTKPDAVAEPPGSVSPVPDDPQPERNPPMKRDPTRPPPPTGADPPPEDLPDPLAEAEGLRAALAEVLTRATRLVAALRHGRREKKVLASVWAGLKQLNLAPGGRP